MAAKSTSWFYDGPALVGTNQQSHNENDGGGNNNNDSDRRKIETTATEEEHSRSINADHEKPGSGWTERNNGRITCWLMFCTIVVTLASSVQYGYNSGCITASSPLLRTFINESKYSRDGKGFSPLTVDIIMTFTETCFRFGGAFGSQSGGQIATYLGRRNGLLVQNLVSVLGSTMLALTTTASSVELLLIGRLFVGFGSGMALTMVPLYLSEISPTNRRGAIGGFQFLMFTVGLLLSQSLSFFPLNTEDLWVVALSLGGIFGLFGLVMIPFCPETPRHLAIAKDRSEEAEKVLKKLRGKDKILKEIADIAEESQVENERGIGGFLNTCCCRIPGSKRPMYMAIALELSQQVALISAFTFNSLETWRNTGIDEESLYYAIVGSDGLMVLAALIPIFISDSFGRKGLVIVGYSFCVLFLATLTVSLSLIPVVDSDWTLWGSLISLYAFLMSFSIGPGCMPYVIIPEMFTHSARPFATGASNQIFWVSSLILSIIYPLLLGALGSYTFIVFIVLLVPLIVLMQIYLPETKRNTYVENASVFLSAAEMENDGLSDVYISNGQDVQLIAVRKSITEIAT